MRAANAPLRYTALLAARDRGVLAPLLALALVLLGVYEELADGRRADVGAHRVPRGGADRRVAENRRRTRGAGPAAAHARRRGRRARESADPDAGVGATLALLVVAVLLVYPLAIGAFDRPVVARDVIAAALAHTSCAVFGVALGRLAAPPVTERAATALLLVLGATIASAALAGPLGIAAGPGKVADALAAAAPGAIPAVLVAAAAATVTLAGLLELIARASSGAPAEAMRAPYSCGTCPPLAFVRRPWECGQADRRS